MVYLIDNYDSFSYNLYQYVGELLYEKPAVDTYSTGEENIVTVCYHFEFKNDFALESLTNNRGFHDIAGDYQACWNFLSAEEVQRIYDRGLEIEAEL